MLKCMKVDYIQYNDGSRTIYEETEDTTRIIRIRKSMKDRQHNGQKKKDKQRSTKHTHKTKDRVT